MNRIKESGQAVMDTEESELTKAAGEYMFSGLRLTEGVSLSAFAARFGQNMEQLYPGISGWVREGLMETQGNHLRLTRRGLLVANSIFTHFV
jgi:oxygen-independent coproporphyrinogen-3 oxidase